ncbi:MAG: hypothetical protein PF574_07645 [Candidatus Delongbacteria bacterium]|nr:hypothetical protein [Candidatus Delongbacteria bacterium]
MRRLLALLMIIFSFSLFSQSELSAEEMAMFKSNVVVPQPSEIIMALDRLSEVKWKEIVKYNYTANYAENYKIALNLGVRVAQGFIAIQAEDRKSTGEMFSISKTLAENFGANSEMFIDKDQISKLLNDGKWMELRGILDGIHLEIKIEMKKYDPDYVALASIGGWIEGLDVVTRALLSNYSEDASTILYQPELIEHLASEILNIKETNNNNPEVNLINEEMPKIQKLCDMGFGNPIPLENIKQLSEISGKLIKAIITETKKESKTDDIKEESKIAGLPVAVIIALFVVFFIILKKKKKGGK